MSLASLDAALSGMRVAQQQISNISNNVANVSTPGYTRKLVGQTSQSIQGLTVGVASETIVRNVSLNLSRDLWTQVSAVGFSTIQQSYLSRVEQFHGPPDAELSIAAEISRLKDSFSALSDTPGDIFLQASVVNEAQDVSTKINDLATLINSLRNDAQTEAQQTVTDINSLLNRIAVANQQIQSSLNLSRSTAALEDDRDSAIKELSNLIEISFFKRGDGVMVVQTNQGVELADENARKLMFNAKPLAATTYYPDSVEGIYVVPKQFNGDPSTLASAIDITDTSPNGKLGGLIDLRDDKFPRQLAQLDELAHKLAMRFEAQGLKLFTDSTGKVPADTAPDPDAGPPATSVPYVGFASDIQVNAAILLDSTLLQQGTTGESVSSGSNQVIRRVLQFTFGDLNYQQAINSAESTTGVDLLNTGGDDLQTWLGLYSTNNMHGNTDLTQYTSVAAMLAAGSATAFGTSPGSETDRFTIAFSDPDLAIGTQTVTVDLRDAAFDAGGAFEIGAVDPVGGGTIDNAAEQLRAFIQNEIDTIITGTPAVARYAPTVSIGSGGELNFSATSDITIAAAGTEGLSETGFAYLGMSPQTVEATDPYFDIAVGNNTLTRITIDPNDTITELVAQLNAVPGLAVDESQFATAGTDTGFLRLRPGNDYTNPDFGGDLKIVGGSFKTNGATYAATGIAGGSTRASIDDGVNIVSALFGTYSTGPIQNNSPVTATSYASETDASATPPIPTLAFRETLLGPDASISTQIVGAINLIDYAQRMVNQQAQELTTVEGHLEDDSTLQDILEQQLQNESGVNLDEELGNLILYQNAFSASARVINAVDDMFKELLNAIGFG